jgi:hypothetical protein
MDFPKQEGRTYDTGLPSSARSYIRKFKLLNKTASTWFPEMLDRIEERQMAKSSFPLNESRLGFSNATTPNTLQYN